MEKVPGKVPNGGVAMSRSILSVLVFTLSLACVGAETSDYSGAITLTSNAPGDTEETVATREVYINRVKLDSAVVQAAEAQYQTTIQDGRYWYDAACGAWGVEDGPTAGFLIAGLDLPGPLPQDISGGGMYSGRTATGKSVFWYPGM